MLKVTERSERMEQEYTALSERLISWCVQERNMKLEDRIHAILPRRLMRLDEEALWSLYPIAQSCFPVELEAGALALEMIEEALGQTFPPEAAAAAAVTLIEAELGGSEADTVELMELIGTINELVLQKLNVTAEQNPEGYTRYLTHLKHFARRVVLNYHFNDDVSDIMSSISERYVQELECSKLAAELIHERYQYTVGRDELLYLTAHLAYLTRKR